MSQYPNQNLPPSYESVINSDNSHGNELFVNIWVIVNRIIKFKNPHFIVIGGTINTQPAMSQVYPILPTAPPMMPPPQNYGSISEVIQTQPSNQVPQAGDVIAIVSVNGCPICRIGVLEDDYR